MTAFETGQPIANFANRLGVDVLWAGRLQAVDDDRTFGMLEFHFAGRNSFEAELRLVDLVLASRAVGMKQILSGNLRENTELTVFRACPPIKKIVECDGNKPLAVRLRQSTCKITQALLGLRIGIAYTDGHPRHRFVGIELNSEKPIRYDQYLRH